MTPWLQKHAPIIAELWNYGHSQAEIAVHCKTDAERIKLSLRELAAAGVPLRGGYAKRKRPRKAAYAMKKRRCLHCQNNFDSEWIGHRICGSCKDSEIYRSGVFA